MSVTAPNVYIGGVLMNSYAYSSVPMLGGLSFGWGNDSLVDFDSPKTLSAQLLIRTPSTLDFLAKGKPFGVLDPDTGNTLFAGRISTLTARPDSRKKDALLVSLTATDTLADLLPYRLESVYWVQPANSAGLTGQARHNQLAGVMPPGWTLAGGTPHDSWTSAGPFRGAAVPLIELIDRHCRSVLGRRHITTTYVPSAGGLVPRLTITPERAKAAAVDRLAARSNGEWHSTSTAPASTGFLQLAGNHVSREIEWEKTPDDTITDVALRTPILEFEVNDAGQVVTKEEMGSWDIWVNSYLNVNNARLQAEYGLHQIQLDVDTHGGDSRTNPHIGQIVNYWVDADTEWRPTSVLIPDSRRLPLATLRTLLNVTTRHNAYVTVDGLPANNPAGGSKVRAYVIAGTATWTGKKWEITLTLGRIPRPAAAAGNTTFQSIAAHADARISAGTAETVGAGLSFADFRYIGS